MPREPFLETLKPSLLDRLIDPDAGGTAAVPGYRPEQMMAAVYRDLEDLLNTRQSYPDLPEDAEELRRSVLAYGMPDLTSLDAFTPQQREDIGRVVAKVIATFEPRLRDVRATMVEDPEDSKGRKVRFRVSARLHADPAPPIPFGTIVELTEGRLSLGPADAG